MKITYKNTELLSRLDERIVLDGKFEGIWDASEKVLRLYFTGIDGFPGLVCSTEGDEIFELTLEPEEEICSEGNIVYIEFPEYTVADISTSRYSGNIKYLESSGYAIGANILRSGNRPEDFIEKESWYRAYRILREGTSRNLRRLDQDGKIISQDYYYYDYTALYLLMAGLPSGGTVLYNFDFSNDPTVQLFGYALRDVYKVVGNTEKRIGREVVPLSDVPGLELHESENTTDRLITRLSAKDLQVSFDHQALIGVGIRNAEIHATCNNRAGQVVTSNILRLTEVQEKEDWEVISPVIFTENGEPMYLFQYDDYTRKGYRTLRISTSYDEVSLSDIEISGTGDDYFEEDVRIEYKNRGSDIVINIYPKLDNAEVSWIPKISADTPCSRTVSCFGHSLTYHAVICPNQGELYVRNEETEKYVSRVNLPHDDESYGLYAVGSPKLGGSLWRALGVGDELVVVTPSGLIKPIDENIEVSQVDTRPRLRSMAAVATTNDDLKPADPYGDDGKTGGGGGTGGTGGGPGGSSYGTGGGSGGDIDTSPKIFTLPSIYLSVGQTYILDRDVEDIKAWVRIGASRRVIDIIDGYIVKAIGVGVATVHGLSPTTGNSYNITVYVSSEGSLDSGKDDIDELPDPFGNNSDSDTNTNKPKSTNQTSDLMLASTAATELWSGVDVGSVVIVAVESYEVDSESFPGTVLGENWRDLLLRAFREVPVKKLGPDFHSKITVYDHLYDYEEENKYASLALSAEGLVDSGYDYVFTGLGDYCVWCEANFPVRFRTESDLITMSATRDGEGESEYATTNGIIILGNDPDYTEAIQWSEEQYFFIHLRRAVDTPTMIELNYDCIDGREADDTGVIKIMILPPMAYIITEATKGVIFMVQNDPQSFNRDYYFKSYSDSINLSLRYRLSDGGWTGTGSADSSGLLYPGGVVNMDNRIHWTTGDSSVSGAKSSAKRGYFTVNSITGAIPHFPITPMALISLNADPSSTGQYGYSSYGSGAEYFVYPFPEYPRDNAADYIAITNAGESHEDVNISPGIFLAPEDPNNARWRNGVKFLDVTSYVPNLFVTAERHYTEGTDNLGYTFRIYNKIRLNINLTSLASWENVEVGGTLGTIVIRWSGDEIISTSEMIDTSMLYKGATNVSSPYNTSGKIYTQTIHLIKQRLGTEINGAKSSYIASGTYDSYTGEHLYDVVTARGCTFYREYNDYRNGMWYEVRQVETSSASPNYSIDVVQGTSQFNLTVYPRYGVYGTSLSLGNPTFATTVQNYQTPVYGKFTIYKIWRHYEGTMVYTETPLIDHEFSQDGFYEGIVLNNTLYVGQMSETVSISPTVSYDTTKIKVNAFAAKLSDLAAGRKEAYAANNSLEVKVFCNGELKSSNVYPDGKVSEIELEENGDTESRLYEIQFIHLEPVRSDVVIKHMVCGTVLQDCNAYESEIPDGEESYWIKSYGSMNKELVFKTKIPLLDIKIVEVDDEGNLVNDGGLAVGRIKKKEDNYDSENNKISTTYSVRLRFSPNDRYPENPTGTLWERIRRIEIRNSHSRGNPFKFKQGYYAIKPSYTLSPVYDTVDFGGWVVGAQESPVLIPSYRNTLQGDYRVLISFKYFRREHGGAEEQINVKDLIAANVLEIDETKSSTSLYPAVTYYNQESGKELDTSSWFKSIETDIITESTTPGLDLPALETVYTVSSAGFIERDVIAKEIVSLKSGILDDNGKPLYESGNLVVVESKIQIWYRKIGEDLKDE